MNASPLETALSASKPLPVELLVNADQRRPIGRDRLEYETQRAEPPADPVDDLVAEISAAREEEA